MKDWLQETVDFLLEHIEVPLADWLDDPERFEGLEFDSITLHEDVAYQYGVLNGAAGALNMTVNELLDSFDIRTEPK